MNVDGFRIERRGVTGSTSDDVRAAVQAGAADGLVIAAREQTGGRGRRGRSWFSPPGNLYVSILQIPALPQAQFGLFSFAAALALADALPETLAYERVRLKWPNDVLVDGAKLAGILLESCDAPQGRGLIIGMGVNIAQAPQDTPYAATAFAALGLNSDKYGPDWLLARFLPALAGWRARLEHEGFAPLRAAWLARAAGLEEELVARLPTQNLTGRFKGIDAEGHLLLQQPNGILRRIAAGEVFAPMPPNGGFHAAGH